MLLLPIWQIQTWKWKKKSQQTHRMKCDRWIAQVYLSKTTVPKLSRFKVLFKKKQWKCVKQFQKNYLWFRFAHRIRLLIIWSLYALRFTISRNADAWDICLESIYCWTQKYTHDLAKRVASRRPCPTECITKLRTIAQFTNIKLDGVLFYWQEKKGKAKDVRSCSFCLFHRVESGQCIFLLIRDIIVMYKNGK